MSGVCTELDDYPEYPYYLRVPADDSPINIYDVVAFYDKVYSGKDKEEIANSIRAFAVEHFDFKVGLKPVIDYING